VLYRLLADLVMVAHGALLIFFVIAGFLAWRWQWVLWPHLLVVLWNLSTVVFGISCPLTALEKNLRVRGGEQPYAGGYIQHYIDGTVYPAGYTWLVQIVCFALVLISYAGLIWWRVSRREGHHSLTPNQG
jgi:membrane protein implicated in regulation of membrane protease activity